MDAPRSPSDISAAEVAAIIVEQAAFSSSNSDITVLVQLLDGGVPPRDAARLMDMQLSTIYRLMARRDVSAAVERGRRARASCLRSRLVDVASRGVDVFMEVMNDKRERIEVVNGEEVRVSDYLASPETRMAAAEKALQWAIGKPGHGEVEEGEGRERGPAAFVQLNQVIGGERGGDEGSVSEVRRRLTEIATE